MESCPDDNLLVVTTQVSVGMDRSGTELQLGKESDQDDTVIGWFIANEKGKKTNSVKLLLTAHDLLTLGTVGTELTREG